MSNEELESIERKLSVIVRLLAQLLLPSLFPDAPQKDKIAFLTTLDLTVNEIAVILGTTEKTVRARLSELKKQSK